MLSTMEQRVTAPRWQRRAEQGSSLVEFALVVTLLCTLLLGIIIFGVLLSKRQVLTQAVAEGARYAVPVAYSFLDPDDALNAAFDKTNESLEAVGDRQCPAGSTTTNILQVGTLATDGIRCTFAIFDCADPTQLQTAAITADCIEVKVEISLDTDPALVPGSSLIAPFLPEIMTGRSVVGLSGLT